MTGNQLRKNGIRILFRHFVININKKEGMRILAYILIVLFLSCKLYAQDCCERLELRAIENHNLNEMLRQKNDTISLLIKSLRDSHSKNMLTTNDGQETNPVNLKMIIDYYTQSFDLLVDQISIPVLERDLRYLSQFDSDENAITVIQDLILFANAKNLLYGKYEKQNVDSICTKLDNITSRGQSVGKLRDLLSKWAVRTEGLRITINDIQKENESLPGDSDILRQEKLNGTWSHIGQYLFAYGVDLEDYPGLRRIIFDLIKRKQQDANARVSDFLEKF